MWKWNLNAIVSLKHAQWIEYVSRMLEIELKSEEKQKF